MWEIVRALAEGGTTILLCTQYLEEADQLADRVGIISAGKLVAEGTPAQLKAEVGRPHLDITLADGADAEHEPPQPRVELAGVAEDREQRPERSGRHRRADEQTREDDAGGHQRTLERIGLD